MAVNLITSPTTPISIDDEIQWQVQITDLGTPGTSRKTIGYQLYDNAAGSDMTEVREINPANTSIQPVISFRNEFYKMRTVLPSFFSAAMQDGKGLMKLKLKYGELVHTFATGLTTGIPLAGASAEVVIINSAVLNPNSFEALPATFLMTKKLSVNRYDATSVDWIYGYGAVVVEIKDHTGTTVSTQTGTAGMVNIFPIGAAHFVALQSIPYYTVNITAADLSYTYTFKRCAANTDLPLQIIYLDPNGGYTAMTFSDVDTGIESEKEKVQTYRKSVTNSNINTYLTEGGAQLMNAKGYPTYNFELRTSLTKDNNDVITRMLMSENYYIVNEHYQFVKFQVTESQSIKEGLNTRIRISGRLANPLTSAINSL